MPRNMSFSLTTDQIRDQSKTVTRRKGWKFLKPGDVINACVRCMGLKPGEKVEHLCQIRVVDVRVEPLIAIDDYDTFGGYSETSKEGFPIMSGEAFAEMFCEHMGGDLDQTVTRIEFEYV